ncbi:hypothetical protein [Microbispora sp. ATCC PTA-5024]|uniref:hypothetical protein n=1 Tax=Microbispora sp. ATCC PTA-5024 TaxID=316330 RepID=UPI0003DBFCB1|nr:hypothetical protein [Microbispora sp. ATCC PTA-5024]ETK35540.1 hypothetical protein MPTA5024_13375 [Microbispora sp. ATCC PTA-5024]
MNVRRLLAATPLALTLAVSACGAAAQNDVASADGGTAKPAASASGSAPTDRREAQLKFAQCMREHGVNMQDPGPNGEIKIEAHKGDGQNVQEAQQACQHFLQASIGEAGGKPDPRRLDQALKFAQCMREHGIDVPDPTSDGMIQVKIKAGTPESKVKAAQEACQEFAPGKGAP